MKKYIYILSILFSISLSSQELYWYDVILEVEGEDTLTTLTNYVNAMDDSFDKTSIIQIFKSLYVEAQEV